MERPLYLTTAGREVLAKALVGKELKFSKVAFGAGDFDYDTERVADLTKLRDWRVDLPLVDKYIEGGVAFITAELKNFTLETGFSAKEIGIYAIDPDTGVEILYAYRNKGAESDFIPGGSSITKKNLRFEYRVQIEDAPNVTFNIDYSFAHVTKAEFEAHLKSENPHPKTPTKLDDVDTTSEFWATDYDSNLHKISIPDAKKLLLSDTEKNLAIEIKRRKNLENFVEIKNEIGLLEPNILQIEDFEPETTIDRTKIQVTSCAQGSKNLSVVSLEGLLIGAEYFISDGDQTEVVKVANVTISNSAIIINNATIVVTLENNLVNAYDISDCHLYRTTFNGNKTTLEMQKAAWSGTENFKGRAANLQVTNALDADSADISGDGKVENGIFTLE